MKKKNFRLNLYSKEKTKKLTFVFGDLIEFFRAFVPEFVKKKSSLKPKLTLKRKPLSKIDFVDLIKKIKKKLDIKKLNW